MALSPAVSRRGESATIGARLAARNPLVEARAPEGAGHSAYREIPGHAAGIVAAVSAPRPIAGPPNEA